MTRDSHVVKRNAFVIPGGLLAVICLVGILYGIAIRPDNTECGTGARMLLWGACYHVATVFAPPFVLGAFLAIFGALRYRSGPDDLEGHLHFGTGTHFTMSLLIGLIGFPMLIWIAIKAMDSRDGTLHSLTLMGTSFEMAFLLEIMMLLGVLMLGPFLGLFFIHGKMRRDFLAAAQAMSEAEAAVEEQYQYDEYEALPEEQSEDPAPEAESWQEPAEEPWTEAPEPEAPSAPAPEPAEPKATAEDVFGDPDAAPLADDEWDDEPAGP